MQESWGTQAGGSREELVLGIYKKELRKQGQMAGGLFFTF